MLRITIELVPYGVEAEAREIAQMIIANTSGGASDYGRYEYSLRSQAFGVAPELQQTGVVGHHLRQQSVWRLVHRVLNDLSHRTGWVDSPQEPVQVEPILWEDGSIEGYKYGDWTISRPRETDDWTLREAGAVRAMCKWLTVRAARYCLWAMATSRSHNDDH